MLSFTAGSTVTGAIRQAAQATGTSLQYLLVAAQVESGLEVGAATSWTRGPFQFIEQTWLGTVKQSGAALGYGRYGRHHQKPNRVATRSTIRRCAAKFSRCATSDRRRPAAHSISSAISRAARNRLQRPGIRRIFMVNDLLSRRD